MKRSLIILPVLTIFTFCIHLAFYYQKGSIIFPIKEYGDLNRSHITQSSTHEDMFKNMSEEQITRLNFLMKTCKQESNQLYNNSVYNSLSHFHRPPEKSLKLLKSCRKHHNCRPRDSIKIQTHPFSFPSSRRYYCNKEYNFCVCVVPKAGSTFWSQIFQVIAKTENYTFNSVFIKPRNVIHGLSYRYRANFEDVVHHERRSILLARDPYSRLYSAFIDKIYLPEKLRMSVLGISVNQLPKCSADNITFEDFLTSIINTAKRYQISTFKSLNPHWRPASDLCHPCLMNPFAIVKQESFTDDVEYSLKRINISEEHYNFISNALHNNSVDISITELMRKYESSRTARKIKQYSCLTPVELASRIWHAFQIQGFIHKDASFPWKEVDTLAQNLTSLNLMKHIARARENYQMTSALKLQQRKSYLNDAYKGADRHIIIGLQNVYRNDFVLYNYDKEPPS